MSHTEDRAGRPLVATADEALLDDVLRLAAAAGVTPEVIVEAGAARRAWSAAGAVVVGADLAEDIGATRPPRRDGVVVVGTATNHDRPADHATGDGVPSQGRPIDAEATRSGESSVLAPALAIGAEAVVWLPDDETDLVDRLGRCLDGQRQGAAIAVVGGSGGCGTSTFAAALAQTAAERSSPTLLIDADPLGGGLDLLLGSEMIPGMRWPDLVTTHGRLAASALRSALPAVRGQLSVLSCDRAGPATIPVTSMRSVIAAGRRGFDLVVVDAPRRIDPLVEEVLTGVDRTLLVTAGDVRGVAAAAQAAAQLRPLNQQLQLIVRTVRSARLDCDAIATSLGLPIVASMRTDRRVAQALDDGLAPLLRRHGPLAHACRQVLDHLELSSGVAA